MIELQARIIFKQRRIQSFCETILFTYVIEWIINISLIINSDISQRFPKCFSNLLRVNGPVNINLSNFLFLLDYSNATNKWFCKNEGSIETLRRHHLNKSTPHECAIKTSASFHALDPSSKRSRRFVSTYFIQLHQDSMTHWHYRLILFASKKKSSNTSQAPEQLTRVLASKRRNRFKVSWRTGYIKSRASSYCSGLKRRLRIL